MADSMRAMFARAGIANEYIGLRNSLAKHDGGVALGLREASRRFVVLASGDGVARGCQTPSQLIAGDLAYVVPSWVAVDARDIRTVEGVLTRSRVTSTDFPLRPWHTYYDWNFFVRVDKQYTYLHSRSNVMDHDNVLECEWDTAFVPAWAWPQQGDRVMLRGRWIYDCGHPGANGYKTEIHPPKVVVSFRSEATQLPGNAGPTPARSAVVYIGRDGGYWQQALNGEDYTFDLYLPPKPYSEAVPRWRISPQTGALPVQPQVTPLPADNPRLLRVVIPLRGVSPSPAAYGLIMWGGWSDPRGTQSAGIHRVKVVLDRIYMDGDYDTFGDEWYVYVGINGRWKFWNSIGGSTEDVSFTVNLDLAAGDRIHVTACGFEADLVHDYMGDGSGYSWAEVSDPSMTVSEREEIEDDVFWQLAPSFKDENDGIGRVDRFHASNERNTFTTPSTSPADFRLRYAIASR